VRYNEVDHKYLSIHISDIQVLFINFSDKPGDEYTEIGSEVKRRSNVYNPLDMERIGENRDSHGTYTMLRESSMLENIRPPLGLPPGEYFTRLTSEPISVYSSIDCESLLLAASLPRCKL
jgi:hypothetical protein